MPIHNSDEDILNALKKGKHQALGLLYDKYAHALLGVLQKITGDKAVAEEKLQVCFIKIWQHKNQYNPATERLFTWMLKIAREVSKSIPVKDIKDTENQNKVISVGIANAKYPDFELMMDLVLIGNISEQEAAAKTGVPIHELREMIRKEINQLRGITVE